MAKIISIFDHMDSKKLSSRIYFPHDKPKPKGSKKLVNLVAELYEKGIERIGECHEIGIGHVGNFMCMINKKSCKIHVECPHKNDDFLACGPLIFGSEDNYLYFEVKAKAAMYFVTCDKCWNMIVLGRMHF